MFDALGDQTRFNIVRVLARGQDICVSEVAEEIGISTPGVSQQLKVLEVSGLVNKKRMGQKICYRLRRGDPTARKLIALIKN